MNQSNIDALHSLITQARKAMREQILRWSDDESSRALALWLASRGVLVPSAIVGPGKVYVGDSESPVGEADGADVLDDRIVLKNLRLYGHGEVVDDPEGTYGGAK